jgi:hypothetical protein
MMDEYVSRRYGDFDADIQVWSRELIKVRDRYISALERCMHPFPGFHVLKRHVCLAAVVV